MGAASWIVGWQSLRAGTDSVQKEKEHPLLPNR